MAKTSNTRLIISPPAAGKTTACIQQIQAFRNDHPLAHIWVVVPDRLQAAAFRRRLAETGGALRVTVSRFHDLYLHILERTGASRPITSPSLQHRLVQDVIARTAAAGELPHFSPIEKQPGFVLALRDAFTELKRAMVDPDTLLKSPVLNSPARQELALLYQRYQNSLQSLNWADSDDLSWLAVKSLEEQPDLVLGLQIVIIDGFDSFTGAQHKMLQALSTQAGKLWITFPGLPASNRQAHRRFTDTIDSLIRNLAPQMTLVGDMPHLPPDLQRIEKVIFEPVAAQGPKIQQPCLLLEARSPADESREALRWVKNLVIREDIPLSACAIFTPNTNTYHPALRTAAAEFGMPVYFTQSDPLSYSPAITAIKNLLTLPAQNFKTRLLVQILRSPYFNLGFDAETIDQYELISQVAQITEGHDQWAETWERLLPEASHTEADFDEERILRPLPRGDHARQLQVRLESFFDLLAIPQTSNTQVEWITWLEDLLEKVKFDDRTTGERDQAACEAFRETLRALVLSETVVGKRQVDYAQFLNDLEGTLESVELTDNPSTRQPALLVGRMAEARGARFQAVAILGLSEGVFPAVEHPDPFMDEDLRAELGLEPRLDREQAGLFYQAVTRADRYLLLTRPYLSDDGEDWQPSPYWKAVQTCFSNLPITKIRPDDPRPLSEAASTQELLFWAVRARSLPARYGGALAPRWEYLHHARDILTARRARQPAGPYEGMPAALQPLLAERFNPAHTWSPSRLETYTVCPFQFYVDSALGLEPRLKPQLGLEPAQLGSLLHKILEETYLNAADPANLDAVLVSLDEAAERNFARAPRAYGFRPSPLWNYEQIQLLDKLKLTVQALADDSQWHPVRFEQAFGIHGTPALEIDLDDGHFIRVRGIIDRVDQNEAGELRVLDYKTGSAHMDLRDLTEGRRLQLPIYALAVRDALGLGKAVDGIYWKILAAEAGKLKLAAYKTDAGEGLDEAVQVLKDHLRRIIRGVRSAEFLPHPPRDGCPAYCPAARWCWHYAAGW